MGTTTWSPLDSGILSGKYNENIPSGSRLEVHAELRGRLTAEKTSKVKALTVLSKNLDCTLAQLAIAWCLKNRHVSSVIIGASNHDQLRNNLGAIEVKHRLVDSAMEEIDEILNR